MASWAQPFVVLFGLASAIGPVAEADASAAEATDDGRVRVGFDIDSGVGAGGGATGLLAGAKLRLGWQLDHRVAACLQGAIFWWDSSKTRLGNATAEGAIGFQLTPVFSLITSDVFEVAAGPSLDRLYSLSSSAALSSTSSASTASANESIYDGVHLGVDGRFALLIGKGPSPDSGRRSGFSIGADVHTTFVEGSPIAFFTVGVGTELY